MELKFGMDMVFVAAKPLLMSEFQKFQNLALFMTSLALKITQIDLNFPSKHHKTRSNDYFEPKFGMGMVFGGVKTVSDVRISEFLKYGTFYDVTSTKNYPKLPKFPLKHDKTR